jgi:hypothetical protein
MTWRCFAGLNLDPIIFMNVGIDSDSCVHFL